MSDDQARRQVLDPARQFIDAGSLRVDTATYLLMSCSAEDGPPYRGRVYLTFEVPTIAETRAVFADLARAMSSRGWRVGTRPSHHPEGWTLAKNGVLAVYYRNPDVSDRAVLKIDGECRDFTDHHADTAGFVDITGDLNLEGTVGLNLIDMATISQLLANDTKFTLISYTGSWNTVAFNGYADGSRFNFAGNEWIINYDDTTGGDNFSSDHSGAVGFVTMTVVPEPSSLGLALLAGGFLVTRRRRNGKNQTKHC
jgi:hypothetical protein